MDKGTAWAEKTRSLVQWADRGKLSLLKRQMVAQLIGTVAAISPSILTAADRILRLSFVDIQTLDNSIIVKLPYATNNNFTHQQVYPAGSRAYLRRPVALALAAVQQELKKQGLGLKVFDAYRPFSIQETFWKLVPNEKYVAKPVRQGGKLVEGSVHTRGAAVDLTLVDSAGKELEMPSAFDEFSEKAHRDYTKASPSALKNRAILEAVMTRHGFVGLPSEWWHFNWKDAESFPLSDEPIDRIETSGKSGT